MIRELPKRLGPTWVEIIFSLGCSLLIASDVFVGRASILPQSAEMYYGSYPQARAFHSAGVGLDILFLVSTLAWILFPATEKVVRIVLVSVAALGLVLCWSELNWALRLNTGGVFELRDLPIRPLSNAGLLGAEFFGTYLVFRIPSGKLEGWQSVLVRLGLSVCLVTFQTMMWDGLSRSVLGTP